MSNLPFLYPVHNSHELVKIYLTQVTLSLRCNHASVCHQILVTWPLLCKAGLEQVLLDLIYVRIVMRILTSGHVCPAPMSLSIIRAMDSDRLQEGELKVKSCTLIHNDVLSALLLDCPYIFIFPPANSPSLPVTSSYSRWRYKHSSPYHCVSMHFLHILILLTTYLEKICVHMNVTQIFIVSRELMKWGMGD